MRPVLSLAVPWLGLLVLSACTGRASPEAAVREPATIAVSPRFGLKPLPTGATRIGTSPYATVMTAPPDPTLVAAAPVKPRPSDGRGWYAQDQGIGEAEAQARLKGQSRLRPTFTALMNRLRREQAGNYVGAMLRHQPDWAYVFFFKRDAARTLARYTKEPRFLAETAVYSQQDRERIIAPWTARWQAEGVPVGYGLDAVYPTMDVSVGMAEADYRVLAAARGWGEPPAPIVLKFTPPPIAPAVDPRAAPFLRGFASEKFATLMQLEALGVGTLTLEDGCLKVSQGDGKKATAVFHHETGIGFDADGYLALIDRMTGKVRARVGEKLAWGAPNTTDAKAFADLAAYRAQCPGELVNVGNPDSAAVFEARYPHVFSPEPAPPPPPVRN